MRTWRNDATLLGFVVVVAIFDSRAFKGTGVIMPAFVMTTNIAFFSVIVACIFLEPLLEVLKETGQAGTAASGRLERTKRWNFNGAFATIGSSTVTCGNLAAHFELNFFYLWVLQRSVLGSRASLGLLDSILNTAGMALLCGVLKDVPFAVYRAHSAYISRC
jgi:hypothetical protein